MHNQKAQGITEFALVLPLFLLLVMGIIYFGMAYADYLTMSNSVRSIAHEASLKENESEYPAVVKNCTTDLPLISDIYVWEPSSNGSNNEYLKVNYNTSTKNVDVEAYAKFNKDSAIGNVLANFVGSGIKDGVSIKYSMYSGTHK